MISPLLYSLFLAIIFLQPWQEPATDRIYEEKARQILKEASEKIRAHESLYIGFDYILEDTQTGSDEQTGGVLYTRGDKYYMQLGSHYFISDGETAWVFMEDVNEVHISLAEEADNTITPSSLLQNFATGFRSKWIREEIHDGKNVHIIDLVPIDPQAFFKYRLAIEDARKQLLYTEAHDRQGGIYRYEVRVYEPNPQLPEDQFVFDPGQYPGIEVVDLR